MSNKKIEINPSLFSLNGASKTKKNRVKPVKPIAPIISPNILKNKLLKRIKEHKNREYSSSNNDGNNNTNTNAGVNITNVQSNLQNNVKNNVQQDTSFNNNDLAKYSDDFNDSINYLQSLSKEKKINDEKAIYEKQKERKLAQLHNSTIRNYYSSDNAKTNNTPFVYNELPDDLKEPLVKMNTEQLNISNKTPINIKYKIDNSVPYGVLKGGIKPTMRDWNRTQKNKNILDLHSNTPIIHNPSPSILNDRELKLQALKNKIKEKQDRIKAEAEAQAQNGSFATIERAIINENVNSNSKNIINNGIIHGVGHGTGDTFSPEDKFEMHNDVTDVIKNHTKHPIYENTKQNINENETIIKQICKKTIRRKYTLGKSKIKKSVGVLLKDRHTRKKVILAQKELKEKSINDIKKYLRDHNLIKVGSNAPNDILRKLYESAVLAGELTNNNRETMLHNFTKNNDDLDNNLDH